MSREQANALTSQQRKTLLMPLTQCLNTVKPGRVSADYVVTTLKALEQIGDRREVGLVEQLAAIPITYTDMDTQIQQAAAACLPYLQIRTEEQRQQTTLLRPAEAVSSVRGDALLRATTSASATPEEHLLRATMKIEAGRAQGE